MVLDDKRYTRRLYESEVKDERRRNKLRLRWMDAV